MAFFCIMNHKDSNPNCPPPPLNIRDELPLVDRKPLPFSPSNSTAPAVPAHPAASNHQPPRCRHPIIIYTHPPRVYNTTPSAFKELVQRLTGKPKSSPKVNSAADAADAVDGSSNRTPAQLPPPRAGPDGPPSSTPAEAHRLVGLETAASSTEAAAPQALADETNLYSPRLKKAKLDKDTSNSSSPSPPSENSEFADQENSEAAAYSSLVPFAAPPLYRDPPSSPSSLLEEIPPGILAGIDLDSPLSAAEKLASGKSGPSIGKENINPNTPLDPMNVDSPPGSPCSLIENPFAASLLEGMSTLSVLLRSSETGGKR